MPRRNRNAGQPSNNYKIKKSKNDWDGVRTRSKEEVNKDRFKKNKGDNIIPEE